MKNKNCNSWFSVVLIWRKKKHLQRKFPRINIINDTCLSSFVIASWFFDDWIEIFINFSYPNFFSFVSYFCNDFICSFISPLVFFLCVCVFDQIQGWKWHEHFFCESLSKSDSISMNLLFIIIIIFLYFVSFA